MDPLDATAQLRELTGDVLFLDIPMPGMIGFEIHSQLLLDELLVIFTATYHQ